MKTPKCDECRGACCDFICVSFAGDDDAMRWMGLHAFDHTIKENGTAEVYLNVRCRALSDKGLCTIYDQRPLACRAFEVGGACCLDAIARRGRR